MSEEERERESDRTTAADRVPIPDQLPPLADGPRISLHRRQSRTIAPPRKWRKHGLGQLVCPECRTTVPGISDGFWHLQTVHNQGGGVDLEQWGRDMRQELDEYIDAARGRRGYVDEPGRQVATLAAVLVGVMVVVVIAGTIMLWAATP